MTLDDGRVVHRSASPMNGGIKTVFGAFTLPRWVYAQREGTRFEFVPTDQRLQLPASEVSYLLQEWDQLLGIEQAFGRVREVIETILRLAAIGGHAGAHQPADGRRGAGVSRRRRGRWTCPQEGATAGGHGGQQGDSDGASRGGASRRGSSNQGGKGQQEADGVHRLRLLGGSAACARQRSVVATLFRDADRPKEQPPQAQNKRYWAELSRGQGRREGSWPGPGVPAIAGGDRHTSSAGAMVGASVRWPEIVGDRSARVLARG